jgi:hypothetical protein
MVFNATNDIPDDITEILLKVALNTPNNEHNWYHKICVQLLLACSWALVGLAKEKHNICKYINE